MKPILTCWAHGYWPVALVEIGAFLVAGIWLVRITIMEQPVRMGFILYPITGVALWAVLQLATGASAYRFETGKALLAWAAGASVFLVAASACARTAERNRFLRAILWFG